MKKLLISALLAGACLGSSAYAHDLKNIKDYGLTFASCYDDEVRAAGLERCSILNKNMKCSDRLTDIVTDCASKPLGTTEGKISFQIERINEIYSDDSRVLKQFNRIVSLRNEYMNSVDRILMSIMDEYSWRGESVLFSLGENKRFSFWLSTLINDPDESKEIAAKREIYSYTGEPYPGMDRCMSRAEAMTDMYDCQDQAFRAQDKKINAAYKRLMSGIKDKKLKDRIKDMERTWIKYKEAAPELILMMNQGSIGNLDARSFTIEETMKQINLLERLDGLIR
jgi:uncharacterized protein YecT (DUF1311 family)